MLSRRHLRIKVMQVLYGYFSAGFDSTGAGEKELLLSINRFYELFMYQLSFLTEIFNTAKKQIENARQKHLPTEHELDPNNKFLNNGFLHALSENTALLELYNKRNISWVGENEIVRRAFASFKSNPNYEKYLSSEKDNFEMDKEIVVKLIKKILVDFPPLMQFYEEKSIFWVDDIDIVNMILIKVIRSCKKDTVDKTLNELEWFTDDEDREFAVNLFRKSVMNSDKYEKIITENIVNYEMERVALMDVLLMKMALCELLEFQSIPVNVTLNEYIELAKIYSSPKSCDFINGILDKLIIYFRLNKMFKKSGRGLM